MANLFTIYMLISFISTKFAENKLCKKIVDFNNNLVDKIIEIIEKQK